MHNRRRKVLVALMVAALGLALLPAGASADPADLYFSEYIEGSSYNKALEIYNATGAAVDLAAAGYNVQMYFNGNTSAGLTIDLTISWVTAPLTDSPKKASAPSSASASVRAFVTEA